MVKHVWIITGGSMDTSWLASFYRNARDEKEENLVIAADKGVFYAGEAGIRPDKIIGDFDSIPEGVLEQYRENGTEIRTYPPEKDYTDTHLALMWALEEKAGKVTIFGGLGSRFDHSFANVGLLSVLLAENVEGEIVDPCNRITMIDREHTGKLILRKQEGQKEYISLIPYTEKVTGITLKGFKYPLCKDTLSIGISRGISNELLEEEGSIETEEGILMVIRAMDQITE